MTLKSRLRVSQGHWKRNHWIDHARLTWVIWRSIVSRPWNVSQRPLKVIEMVPFESLGTVSYSLSILTVAVSLAISEIFSDKEWPDFEIWVWDRWSFKVARFDRPCTTFYWSAIVTIALLSSFFLLSSLRGRQLLSCLALRPQIGPNALPLTNQNPTAKAKGYILLKKGKRKSKKHYPSYIKE